jgi:peptide subunit release factor 1 (eRF1)
MATITETPLQDLAAVDDPDGVAISVYLNLDPSVAPTVPDVATHVRSAIDTLRKQRPDESSHEARERFDVALNRVEERLNAGDLRGEGISHGLALFARGEDELHVVELTEPVEDRVSVGHTYALSPLAAQLQRSSDLIVLLASREQGRAWYLADGVLRDLFDEGQEAENRHSKGGWAQSILQRWADNQAEQHLQDVVERLEKVHERLGRPPILVSATDEHAAIVQGELSQQTQPSVIGTVPHLRDLTDGELIERAREMLHRYDCRREEELLERHAAQVGRGEADDGSADAALAALSDSRAEWLLLSRTPTFAVYRCPQCGRLAAEQGPCPLDSTPMARAEEGEEAAVTKALTLGTSVWRLIDVDRTDLDGAGGVGIIARF